MPVAQQLGPTLSRGRATLAVPAPAVRAARAADRRLEDRACRRSRDVLRGATAVARLSSARSSSSSIRSSSWLSIHQQLISDFISDGAAGIAAHDDLVRRRRHRPLPAPVRPDRPRDAVARSAARLEATAATPTRRRCGWRATPAANKHQRRGTAGLGLQEHRRRRRRLEPPNPARSAGAVVLGAPALPGREPARPDPAHHAGELLEQVGSGAARVRAAGRD